MDSLYKKGMWMRLEPETYEQEIWGDNIIEIINIDMSGEEPRYELKFYYDWEDKVFLFNKPYTDKMFESELNYLGYTKEDFVRSLFEYPIPGEMK